MGRKVLLLHLLCLLLTLDFRVQATGRVDVMVRAAGDRPIAGCQVGLSPAGEALEEGYRLEESFGGGVILAEDVFSPDLANWMAERAEPERTVRTDEEGRASFGDLDSGLYLVTQTPEESFRPYLVCITEEISYIDTYPEVLGREPPRTGMDPTAQGAFSALPLSLGGLAVMAVREVQKRRRVRSVRRGE